MRIEAAHQRKANKYTHFLTDIHDNSMNGEPFEVGAHTGYINDRNKASLGRRGLAPCDPGRRDH